MGEPRSAEFERKVRRDVHDRYKEKCKQVRDLMRLLTVAEARIKQLEFHLAEQADIVDMAERIISDGTIEPAADAAV